MIPSVPVYTDMSQLSELKNASRQNGSENLTEVARQFESLFTHMVIKSMRQASLGNDLFNSNGSEMYRDLFDKQIALSLSQGKGLGLADSMIMQMKPVAQEAGDALGKSLSNTLPETKSSAADMTTLPIRPANPTDSNQAARTDTVTGKTATQPAAQPSTAPVPGRTPGLSMHLPTAADSNVITASQRDAALKAYGAVHAPAVGLAMQNPLQANGINQNAVAAPAPLPTEVLRLDQAQKHAARSGTPESFIAKVWPAALRVANELGVSPRVLIAQAALETGWGKSMPKHADGSSGHNYFGIKTHDQWQGQQIAANTTEIVNGSAVREKASFRAYDSIESSFRDFASFLKTNPRYEKALSVTHDANKFVDALQKAGYATDPKYADKIKSIMNGRRMNTMVTQVDTGPSARQVG